MSPETEATTVYSQTSSVEIVPMVDKSSAVSQIDLMFRAFCDQTRLRILSLLQGGELCVGDVEVGSRRFAGVAAVLACGGEALVGMQREAA
jgi:hypothetical protein